MQPNKSFWSQKSTLTGITILLLLMLCAAYANHFTNGFEFDDSHTIVDNEYIRNIKNLPHFFTDIKYFGTNVNNQAYRPVLVSLDAIDYWLAGGLNPVYFHIDIFLSYIALLVLLFFLFRNIFNSSLGLSWRGTKPSPPGKEGLLHSVRNDSTLVALLAVGFYGLHAANAETINYIIQRADSLSTLLIVTSLLLYINRKTRKYFLYVITIALAMGTKEVSIVIGPLFFFYILFFEEDNSLAGLVTFKKIKNSLRALVKSLVAIYSSYFIFNYSQYFFMRGHTVQTTDLLPAALNYYATEAVVTAHYLGNFILPVNLSIGSGFSIYSSVINWKVLFSCILIIIMVVIAFRTSREKEKRPIAFGIIWFFLSLVPSSYLIKSGELANDHRTFLPYIGLVLSLAWWLRLVYLRYESYLNKHATLLKVIPVVYLLIISLHAYGTYQRNKIWSSYENLWHDAVLKNPDAPPALINYGLALMERGKYNETLPYFEHALQINPNGAYINVNMAILKDFLGKPQEADSFFRNAIRLQPYYPVGYYHYARFLLRYGRKEDALAQLEAGLKVSPGDAEIIEELNILKAQTPEAKSEEISKMATFAGQNPTAANYINLSVVYYQNGMYNECIEACENALKLDPVSAMAYNNICGSYNAMQQWAKAEDACKKSLQIDSTLAMAKNNLSIAQKNLK